MKYISLLGSTGSIGINALNVIEKFPNKFSIVGLAAHTSIEQLAIQVDKFLPNIVAVCDEWHARKLKKLIINNAARPKIVFGNSGYIKVAVCAESDMVLNAIVGAAGLIPTISAIDAGKDIALANKESLVMAGKLIMDSVIKNKTNLIPIDSEHSAIYQCLLGNKKSDLKNIMLTGSGGPFLNTPKEIFDSISIIDALKHPNWSMGDKITIDSATLMNKALEIIEAKWLFNVPIDQIKVLIHPQSIVHSMVSYKDGTVIAQMGMPDMRAAISYALSFPDRLNISVNQPNFFEIRNLTFQAPNFEKFPCLKLASIANEVGGAMPTVMNASNEVAVHSFLNGKIPFTKIYSIIRATMDSYKVDYDDNVSVNEIIRVDHWARIIAEKFVNLYKI